MFQEDRINESMSIQRIIPSSSQQSFRPAVPQVKSSKSDYFSDNSASLPGIIGQSGPIGFEPGMFQKQHGSGETTITKHHKDKSAGDPGSKKNKKKKDKKKHKHKHKHHKHKDGSKSVKKEKETGAGAAAGSSMANIQQQLLQSATSTNDSSTTNKTMRMMQEETLSSLSSTPSPASLSREIM